MKLSSHEVLLTVLDLQRRGVPVELQRNRISPKKKAYRWTVTYTPTGENMPVVIANITLRNAAWIIYLIALHAEQFDVADELQNVINGDIAFDGEHPATQ